MSIVSLRRGPPGRGKIASLIFGDSADAVIVRRRRRQWSAAEKRRIVAEADEPGASVSVVARRYDLNTNMLFTWRREFAGSNTKSR
jgi:hypothetical protein